MSDQASKEDPTVPLSGVLSLQVFARTVANLYRREPDQCVITVGDWQPSPVAGRPPLFHGTMRVTVGDFRRWSPDHVTEDADGARAVHQAGRPAEKQPLGGPADAPVPLFDGRPISPGWWWLSFPDGPGPRFWDGAFWNRGSYFAEAEDYVDFPVLGPCLVPGAAPPWQPAKTAPTDGHDFLGLLNNGQRVILFANQAVQRGSRYAWWGGHRSIPYEPSHPADQEWGEDRLRLIGWMELPEGDPAMLSSP